MALVAHINFSDLFKSRGAGAHGQGRCRALAPWPGLDQPMAIRQIQHPLVNFHNRPYEISEFWMGEIAVLDVDGCVVVVFASYLLKDPAQQL